MKSPKKRVINPVFYIILILIVIFLANVWSFDWFKDFKARITGEATNIFGVNITVGAGGGSPPNITTIYNNSLIGGALTEGPSSTAFNVNFTVSDTDGVGNLDSATAAINFSLAGEDVRYNRTCRQYEAVGNQANYTCRVEMWWWDGTGTWTIGANISDNNGNVGANNTKTFSVSETTGFVLSPGNITFATLTTGATNQSASNDPILLNNTGNKDIVTSGVSVNATTLLGEEDNTKSTCNKQNFKRLFYLCKITVEVIQANETIAS